MSLKISRNGIALNHRTFLFPNGEVGLQLDSENYAYNASLKPHQIIARIHSSNDVMELILAVNALRNMFMDGRIDLIMPCFPYAQNDRVAEPGQPNSVVAFADIIKSLGFFSVTIFDPHSDAAVAALGHPNTIPQEHIISAFERLNTAVLTEGYQLVSPDAGSNKKIGKIAKYFGHDRFIRADKLRCTATGKILETIVYCEDLKGAPVLIVDDICHGGKTFTELAQLLKKKGAGKVALYITHATFTNGTKHLFESGIDEIFTTNSFYDVWPAGISDKVVTLNLEEAFKL